MISTRANPKPFRKLELQSVLSFLSGLPTRYICIQKRDYVDVYMKWKKDSYYDTIESIHRSIELKPIIALKNCITAAPSGSIPISSVTKRAKQLDVPMRVAAFLRQYPSVFEEFKGSEHNHPWFRLTPEAAAIDKEECDVYRVYKADLQERLKKFVLMSVEKKLPFKIIQGMQWYLGLPDDFVRDPERTLDLDDSFRIVEMEDGLKGLAVESDQRVVSLLQKNAMERSGYNGNAMEAISYPLFPSKNLRLKGKISMWLEHFQELPYISPYDDVTDLSPDSDLSEKRVVGVLHELLSIFVEHAGERRKLLCLKKYLGLPQKVHKAFERHPHMFYLSLRNKTCTAILKEAYCDKSAIEPHPLSRVRKKYIALMKESDAILKSRRFGNHSASPQVVRSSFDRDHVKNNESVVEEACV